MKLLLLCLNAFETLEFSPFIDVFGWARDDFGCDINVDICGFHKNIKSTFHVSINADILIDQVNVEEYDALAIPGGFEEYGFYEEAYDEKTLALIRSFHRLHKPIAAVCVAAFPLAKSGILQGKKATTYHLRGGYKRDELSELGVLLGEQWLVEDGNIITSSCPKTGADVAFRLLEKLTSKEKMEQVKEAMGFLEREYKYVKTGPDNGWSMGINLYAKCPICGYFMPLDPTKSDSCPCGNMYKDSDYGRFGAETGDMSIEIYEKINKENQ